MISSYHLSACLSRIPSRKALPLPVRTSSSTTPTAAPLPVRTSSSTTPTAAAQLCLRNATLVVSPPPRPPPRPPHAQGRRAALPRNATLVVSPPPRPPHAQARDLARDGSPVQLIIRRTHGISRGLARSPHGSPVQLIIRRTHARPTAAAQLPDARRPAPPRRSPTGASSRLRLASASASARASAGSRAGSLDSPQDQPARARAPRRAHPPPAGEGGRLGLGYGDSGGRIWLRCINCNNLRRN
ncbi:hypothetical protein BDA96_01G463800 [Sorghum bicolor]|uniref:Uncharacterized protein n=1 Tax=Sorghum bicolor TaxID=4558 RepID=A0A921S4M9_SORBI|nr:hypothetical protein BDA96_01G463800 [Sorghum bicolor]